MNILKKDYMSLETKKSLANICTDMSSQDVSNTKYIENEKSRNANDNSYELDLVI